VSADSQAPFIDLGASVRVSPETEVFYKIKVLV